MESDPLIVHLTECNKLVDRRRMREKPEGYLVKGWVEHNFQRSRRQPIKPCESCLYALNYQGFAFCKDRRTQSEVLEKFDLFEFFAFYSSYPLVDHYTYDWSNTSFRARESVNWICISCGVDLAGRKELLHVHHIDRQKTNNRPDNLQALCLACHAQQPGHEHMVAWNDNRQLIEFFKFQQDLHTLSKRKLDSEQAWQEAFEDADPAVHGLLNMLQHKGHPVPEVGADIQGPNRAVILSSAELVWRDRKVAVVLEESEESKEVEELGWTVHTVHSALEELQA